MDNFKFFRGITEEIRLISNNTLLREYHRILHDRYEELFEIRYDYEHYNIVLDVYNTTTEFISQGLLTEFSEIRSYYRLSLENVLIDLGVDLNTYDPIDDQLHEVIIEETYHRYMLSREQ